MGRVCIDRVLVPSLSREGRASDHGLGRGVAVVHFLGTAIFCHLPSSPLPRILATLTCSFWVLESDQRFNLTEVKNNVLVELNMNLSVMTARIPQICRVS